MVSTIIYVILIVLGVVATCLGFYSNKYSIEVNKKYIRFRAVGLLLLVIGFIVHSTGDYLASRGPLVELGLESIAHVIILVAFIFFIVGTKDILNKAKEYWLR